MPAYPWLLQDTIDFASIPARVDAMAMLGVPYGEALKPGRAEAMAREQAQRIAGELLIQGGYPDMEDKKVIALVAYLQRLGTDLFAAPPADDSADDSAQEVAP
jgi:cytochrome c oxidase cbb3-type subunit I/II